MNDTLPAFTPLRTPLNRALDEAFDAARTSEDPRGAYVILIGALESLLVKHISGPAAVRDAIALLDTVRPLSRAPSSDTEN